MKCMISKVTLLRKLANITTKKRATKYVQLQINICVLMQFELALALTFGMRAQKSPAVLFFCTLEIHEAI